MKIKIWLKLGLPLVAVSLAVGCVMESAQRQHRANNLFRYLYPDKAGHIDAPTVPTLSLPLRVGIAFVPVDHGGKNYTFGYNDDALFPEKDKAELTKKISAHFKSCEFVKSIESIPSAYLTPGGSFANLDQIRTMYGVDQIVLLSYDQVQFTDRGLLSLSYWTIIGAYVVRGEKNDTKTMLDAAVYDIPSRKLLFRAPGFSQIKGSGTMVNESQQLREDSSAGFTQAATNLVVNLNGQLDEFRDRVKNAPQDYKIVRRPGYTGAAALGPFEIISLSGMAACFWLMRRKTA